MVHIKQLKSEVKQIIIRGVKENICLDKIYTIEEQYINTFNLNDNIYEELIDVILNVLGDDNFMIEKIKRNKSNIIKTFQQSPNKSVLSHPCLILTKYYDENFRKYVELVDYKLEDIYFFSWIKSFIMYCEFLCIDNLTYIKQNKIL